MADIWQRMAVRYLYFSFDSALATAMRLCTVTANGRNWRQPVESAWCGTAAPLEIRHLLRGCRVRSVSQDMKQASMKQKAQHQHRYGKVHTHAN